MSRGHWIDLFTGETWNEFLAAGADVSGFRPTRWNSVQQLRPGDYLLAYLTGVSRFVGVLEVTSAAFKDSTPIWQTEAFPARVRVQSVVTLTPETGVPITSLRGRLSFMRDSNRPNEWVGHVRGSPVKWSDDDGEVVLAAIREAESDPVVRPVSPRALARRPRGVATEIGTVTAPEEVEAEEDAEVATGGPSTSEQTTEIQWLLLKLGNDMGLDVFVARNDRSRSWNGHVFTDLPRLKPRLRLNLHPRALDLIEMIDVLWLRGDTIIKAFEIENTTSVFSGILRMSDLVALQPNLHIPLYIVAPDERRDKVIRELNRPTFQVLPQRLVDICQYLSFSSLKAAVEQARVYVRFLRPEFLDEIAESCEIEDE